MRLAIMQPYLFPYLGYFQLIAAVDTFVVYDDVSYIKGGWINRNNILGSDGRPERITLQVLGASPNRPIDEVRVGNNRDKLLRTIRQRYARAPQHSAVMPLVERILGNDETNLAAFLDAQLREICAFLAIDSAWHVSSRLQVATGLTGQDRVLAICAALGATTYVNAGGGRTLYGHDAFRAAGIELRFLAPRPVAYAQFGAPFVPSLSIIDILMFNDRPAVQALLREYDLVR